MTTTNNNPKGDAKSDAKKLLSMTAETIGKDLLQALVQEIKLLPDTWPKIPKKKQDDVIDRLRNRVETNVKMAVHLIAGENRATISANVDQVTIKDGIKAVLTLGKNDPNRHALCDAQGLPVLIIVANPDEHTGGMDEIKGESDQRAMDLGHEYDPNGDGKGMDGVIDVVATIEHKPLESELQKAKEDGYKAASEGKEQSTCPIMNGDLCIKWVIGWKEWHKENNTEWWQKFNNPKEFGG